LQISQPGKPFPARLAEDDFTWALAIEETNNKKPSVESMEYIAAAYLRNPKSKFAVALAERYHKAGASIQASQVLQDAIARDSGSRDVYLHYLGVFEFERGNPAGAEFYLAQCNCSNLKLLKFEHLFVRSETAALLNKNEEAAFFAAEALLIENAHPELRAYLA
jgi:hypothetical protein